MAIFLFNYRFKTLNKYTNKLNRKTNLFYANVTGKAYFINKESIIIICKYEYYENI